MDFFEPLINKIGITLKLEKNLKILLHLLFMMMIKKYQEAMMFSQNLKKNMKKMNLPLLSLRLKIA